MLTLRSGLMDRVWPVPPARHREPHPIGVSHRWRHAFMPLAGPDAQAWHQWLLLDAVLFSPWFILGGFAFGATAWFARQNDPGRRDAVREGQR